MKGKFRKAVFLVTYNFQKNKPEYLILKRKLHWRGWEFPKGGIEKFETKKMAIKRELNEEAGLKIKKIKKHNFQGKYFYPKKLKDRPNFVGQTFSLYSVEVEKGKINLDSHEHSDYEWVSYKNALKKLTYENQKDALKMVNDWLENS